MTSDEPRLLAGSDLISSQAAATLLGITKESVIRRVQAGTLAAFAKLDGARGAYVFDKADVEAAQ